MANNFFTDNKDIQFYVNNYIDWRPILDLKESFYENPNGEADVPKTFEETIDIAKTILDYVGKIVADTIFPNSSKIDHDGGVKYDPKTKKVTLPDEITEGIKQLAEAGIFGVCTPRKYGG
ncbi:MAG: hypothetical protein WCG27_04260, partial [Pseudomonadota bacterium]